jgi:hypothetical protein
MFRGKWKWVFCFSVLNEIPPQYFMRYHCFKQNNSDFNVFLFYEKTLYDSYLFS